MATHLTVATAIEKNKIASDKAFLILLEIDVNDSAGDLVETLKLVRNSENFEYREDVYQAVNFKIDISESIDSEPSLKIDADDPSGFIRERMDAYQGGVGFIVRVIILNSDAADREPEIEEEFLITQASSKGYQVSFTLGVDNPLLRRFPVRQQNKDQCTLRFKGPLCKYAGADATCSFTYSGANGCTAKGNGANFGGLRGLNSQSRQ